jgi:transketolase
MNEKDLISFATEIRLHALDMIYHAKASHIGSCFSFSDLLAYLYSYCNIHPHNILSDKRDRIIISKGHGAAAVYAALYLKGFISKDHLSTFCKPNSSLIGHVSHKVNGVEYSSGSLGHGLSIACGMALAEKKDELGYKTICLLSDGELNEGSIWEALAFASHHKLTNLITCIDVNKIQSLGFSDSILNYAPLAKKFEAFGFNVIEIDGHDFSQIHRAYSFNCSQEPLIILAHTTKGKGVSFMENNLLWHYKNPDESMYNLAKEELCAKLL